MKFSARCYDVSMMCYPFSLQMSEIVRNHEINAHHMAVTVDLPTKLFSVTSRVSARRRRMWETLQWLDAAAGKLGVSQSKSSKSPKQNSVFRLLRGRNIEWQGVLSSMPRRECARFAGCAGFNSIEAFEWTPAQCVCNGSQNSAC